MIEFILNHQLIQTSEPEGSTVLDFIRYKKRLTGTKIGCREGDCGACTILVGAFENNKVVYRNMTSCLMPLSNAQGKHVVTVEGINQNSLTPVQQAMVDASGTQCGFCTIGFVMSLTGFVMNNTQSTYLDAIKMIDGNICRCTGYKSIERAAKILADKMSVKPSNKNIEWLIKNNYLPEYFNGVEERLRKINLIKSENTDGLVVGGGTDLIVQKHHIVKKTTIKNVFDDDKLKGILERENQVIIAASTTVTNFAESQIIKNIFPKLENHVKLVSSTPIRNMATIGGNLVNASPIGDMTVFLLALDAEIMFSSNRKIRLKDFYLAYKQLNKTNDEIITKIIFDKPKPNVVFNFEKVCKRTHLDIASVNTACLMSVNEVNEIEQIHLSAGGVAPFPKYLNKTCNYLLGKKITQAVLTNAIKIINDEIAPISDARGTADYKRLLLRQLFLAHFSQSSELIKETLEHI